MSDSTTRLLVTDESLGFAAGFTPTELDALADAAGPVITIRPPPVGSGRTRRPLGDARRLAFMIARHPRAVARLYRQCRTGLATRRSPVTHLIRHLPFVGTRTELVHYESVRVALNYPLIPALLESPAVITCRMEDLEGVDDLSRRRAGVLRALTHATAVHCGSEALAERVRRVTGRSEGVWVVASRVPDEAARTLADMYRAVVDQARAAGDRAAPPPSTRGPRIGSYVRTLPKKPFMATKLLTLLDAGFDLRIFVQSPAGHWENLPGLLEHPELHEHVTFLENAHRSPWGGRGPVRELAHALRRHPVGLARFAAHNWRTRKTNTLGFWKGVRLRLPFVGKSLDILHVEYDAWAPGIADIKDYLGCRLLLTSQATLQNTSVADSGPRAYRDLFELADGYQFGSDYLHHNTLALGLDPSVPAWVIKSAIDTDKYAPPAHRSPRSAGDPLRIISVGRLAPEKGYEFALEAVAHVHRSGLPVTYTIVGDGSARPALERAVERLDLRRIVRFAGNLPTARVITEYHAAEVMLHAAVDEGLSFAVIEAQSTALPAVTTDAGGLRENVEDGVTGYVVPRRDAIALGEKLELLARDPERHRRMGKAARERVLANFDIHRQIPRYRAMYAELLAIPPRAVARASAGRAR